MNRFLNQIIQGDCLEVMRDIPDKSVDLVLTDPPYNINIAQWDIIPTFTNIFNQDTAKKVLLHYISEIEEAYPPLLNYQYDSPKKFFSGFIRSNPNTKLTLPLKMLGLRVLLDEIGVREFREMTKHYGSSAWYSLNKEMKDLTRTDEPSVFSLLREQINKFEPLKLLAIQDKMLNNDKYN